MALEEHLNGKPSRKKGMDQEQEGRRRRGENRKKMQYYDKVGVGAAKEGAVMWVNGTKSGMPHFSPILLITIEWVVPENIHTHTTGGISEFWRGGGVTSTGIPRTWGGYVDWNSEDMGGVSLDWNS